MENSSVHHGIKWLIPCFEGTGESLCLQANNKWLSSQEIWIYQITLQWWQSFQVIQRVEDTIQNKLLEKTQTQLSLPTAV